MASDITYVIRARSIARVILLNEYRVIRHGSIKFALKIGLKAANFPDGRDNHYK